MGGTCTSSTGPPVLHGSILRVQGQGTGTWEQRTTAPWSALHASGLQTFSLLSSFPHSCHHLPHLFHPTTCEWLTWAARIPAQGPAEWRTQPECLQLFWLVTWNMDKLSQLQSRGWAGIYLQPTLLPCAAVWSHTLQGTAPACGYFFTATTTYTIFPA